MRCLTLREAARETGISYKTMLEAVRGGELKAFIPCGLTRKRFVRDGEVERWLQQMEKGAPSQVVADGRNANRSPDGALRRL